VKLGILYHMPFWQAPDGGLWEEEGSFARYVDSLAPYFDEIVLSVPVFDTPRETGSRVAARNVRLVALPYFPGPRQFYPMLPRLHGRLREWVEQCDVINLRVPSPAAIFAFRQARRRNTPIFLLVVGDYQALAPHMAYRGLKHLLFAMYVAFEEWSLRYMIGRALTFTNGARLRRKHERHGSRVYETKTTTLRVEDIGSRRDTCQGAVIRLLTVSRIDPRKGLRVLPAAIAALLSRGSDVTIDLVGPTIGKVGEDEAKEIERESRALGVAERVRLRGPVPLDRLMPLYREYDVFVLPTGPGEGIPRVLLEAMAAGLPIVTTDVAGIGSLIVNEENGLLVAPSSGQEVARAIDRLLVSPALRQQLIQRGYETARAFTADNQAAELMRVVAGELGFTPQFTGVESPSAQSPAR
jgi:glycosyltransferase involved in cell wall biosynthesis